MNKKFALFGMIALALALLAGVMISDQLGVIAFAQETKTAEGLGSRGAG